MSLLLRLSSGLIVYSDTAANRLSTFGGNSWGQSLGGSCTVSDVCSTATDALRVCPHLLNSLFGSLANPSQLSLSHVQFSWAGITVVQTPSHHLSPTLAQHTCSPWPDLERDDLNIRYGLYSFLAVCGTGLCLLKPVAVALFGNLVPAPPRSNENQRSLVIEQWSTGWLTFSDFLTRPPISQLLREVVTKPKVYLAQFVCRPGSITSGSKTHEYDGVLASEPGERRSRKRATKSGGSATPSTTSRGRSRKRQRVAVAPKPKTVRKGRLFACHFYAHDTVAHECCRHYKFDEVRDIKRHMTEEGRGNHRQPIHCVICFSLFDTFAERSAHLRLRTCRAGVCNFDASGLNEDQIASIRGLKKSRGEDEKEFWFKIWDIIFPGEQRPLSPYSDDVDELATRRRVAPRMALGVQQLGLRLGWSDNDVQEVIRVLDSSWGPGLAVSPSPVEQHTSSQAVIGIQSSPTPSSRPSNSSTRSIQSQVFPNSSAPATASLQSPPNSASPTNTANFSGLQPRSRSNPFQSPFEPFNAPRNPHRARVAHMSYNLALSNHSAVAQQQWMANQTDWPRFRTNNMLTTNLPRVHYAGVGQAQSPYAPPVPGLNLYSQGLNQRQATINPIITDNWTRFINDPVIAHDTLGDEEYQSPSSLLPSEHCECQREPGRSPKRCYLHY
ncbi:hypothetical protein BDP55DRAFT_660860 [Colletotrichum godetiae]|uniref:C2H2-type domain-containing protein n=1 Tax=Colletotrichum godetiae TaxID=1209918 RepID=A0AAJ0AMW9_9PEZI|nr:uncharacterized protein BDP55DRAFT_660860 [Colletotrichum godetiae]KAK1676826.1 hypothetical protein BDP55DRAFT_660860 [Colletotrichum godetiae]